MWICYDSCQRQGESAKDGTARFPCFPCFPDGSSPHLLTKQLWRHHTLMDPVSLAANIVTSSLLHQNYAPPSQLEVSLQNLARQDPCGWQRGCGPGACAFRATLPGLPESKYSAIPHLLKQARLKLNNVERIIGSLTGLSQVKSPARITACLAKRAGSIEGIAG